MSFETSFLKPEADAYVHRFLAPPSATVAAIEKEAQDEGRPAVGRATGAALRAIVAAVGAKHVLEVGTNLGYSAFWIADGLPPGGRVDTLELDADLVARARARILEAGEASRIVVHHGAALDLLPRFESDAYDVVFLDCVKAEYPEYLEHARRLLRPGGLVVADNVFWLGQAWDPGADDPDTRGIRAFAERIFRDPEWTSAILPVEDGLSVSVLRGKA